MAFHKETSALLGTRRASTLQQSQSPLVEVKLCLLLKQQLWLSSPASQPQPHSGGYLSSSGGHLEAETFHSGFDAAHDTYNGMGTASTGVSAAGGLLASVIAG